MLKGDASAPVAFDLLDDWLAHSAFARLHDPLVEAYKTMFALSTAVTANSEATLDLARRFGRDDALLLQNGVDPERFALSPKTHSQLTVGYGGKLGFRVDVELVREVAEALPNVSFEFAGPVLAKEQGKALKRIPNVRLLGDVRYDRYPEIMRGWDVAWAPHRLGKFEVGGILSSCTSIERPDFRPYLHASSVGNVLLRVSARYREKRLRVSLLTWFVDGRRVKFHENHLLCRRRQLGGRRPSIFLTVWDLRSLPI